MVVPFKKRFFLLAFAIFIGLFFSCSKEESDPKPSRYTLTFAPYMNGEELHPGEQYINLDGYPFSINDIRFYLSDIRLITTSGKTVSLSEIEFFSIEDHNTTKTFQIPPGDYASIAFNLGVPAALNSPENPDFLISAYSASHPLSESNGMYWIWESGYRFFTLEGHCDTVTNTAEVLPLAYSFHTGRDTLYRSIPAFSRSFSVGDGSPIVHAFALDLSTFFKHGNSHIDLATERNYHGSLAQISLGIKVADNSAASFKLLN